VDWRN